MNKIHAYCCDGCHVMDSPVYSCGIFYGHRDPQYLTDFLDSFTLKRDEICRAFELGFTPGEVIPHLIKSLEREAEISGKTIGSIKGIYAPEPVPHSRQPEIQWWMNNGRQAKELLKKLREGFNTFFEALPEEAYCTYERCDKAIARS
jgi:hypothetical protein